MRSAAFIAALLLAPQAWAQARVEVAPVRLELPAEKAVGSLRLRNTGAAPAAFDVNAMRWTQANGQDVLEPTNALIVSPPAFVIAPGGEQIVRIGTRAPRGAVEQAFRLHFSEQLLADGRPEHSELRVRLELSLPVFLEAAAPAAKSAPVVEIAGAGDDRMVRVTNTGTRHLVLAEAEVAGAPVSLPRYLLAGASVERPAPSTDGPLTLAFVQAEEVVRKEYRFAPDARRGAGQP